MTMLMIADSALTQESLLVARSIYLMVDSQALKTGIVRIDSKEALGKAIKSASGVDHLIIFLHSTDNGLIVGGEYIDFKDLARLAEGGPSIREVSLEGCTAGGDPEAMAQLGRALRAERVHAFNYYHVSMVIRAEVPVGVPKSKLKVAEYLRYRPFVAPNQNADDLFKITPGTYTLLVEWFRISFDETPPPLDRGLSALHHYKSRSDALEVTFRESTGIPSADRSPYVEFQRVTVELDKAEAARDAGSPSAAKTATPQQPAR